MGTIAYVNQGSPGSAYALNSIVEVDVSAVVKGNGDNSFAIISPADNENTVGYASQQNSVLARRPLLFIDGQTTSAPPVNSAPVAAPLPESESPSAPTAESASPTASPAAPPENLAPTDPPSGDANPAPTDPSMPVAPSPTPTVEPAPPDPSATPVGEAPPDASVAPTTAAP